MTVRKMLRSSAVVRSDVSAPMAADAAKAKTANDAARPLTHTTAVLRALFMRIPSPVGGTIEELSAEYNGGTGIRRDRRDAQEREQNVAHRRASDRGDAPRVRAGRGIWLRPPGRRQLRLREPARNGRA